LKRSRRGGRRPQHSGGGGGGGSQHHNHTNPNRSFDSNGPEVKIRGTATQVYEKYLQLARDANSSGDRVMAESYLQHAEHYFRIMAEQQAAQQQYQQQHQQNGGQQNNNGGAPGQGQQPYAQQGASGPSFSLNEEQETEEAGAE
jgi:hypothetical protein